VKRPISVQVVAAIATFYAMAGSLVAAVLVSRGGGRPIWLTIAAAALALTAGSAALSTWRLERHAPIWLLICSVCGATFCLLLPASLQPGAGGSVREVWRAAITAAVLFIAFMGLLSMYMKRTLGSLPNERMSS
jgi:hypothetical protein